MLVLIFSAFVLLKIFLPNRQLFYSQFLNTLLKYEQRLLHLKNQHVTRQTLGDLIKQGITFIAKFTR